MPSSSNVAIIATAGSRKTQHVVEEALAAKGRVLITTYTNENLRQIVSRIEAMVGGEVPANITVMSWFTFLLRHGARPYQSAVAGGINVIRGIDWGDRPMWRKKDSLDFLFSTGDRLFRDAVADFVCRADAATGGRVIRRLEALFGHVFLDEVQDLNGYDLNVLDMLFKSRIEVTVVGDPRQRVISTNNSLKNSRYKKSGQLLWLEEADCAIEQRVDNYRCNQDICDLADKLFPAYAPTVSMNQELSGHDGVFPIKRSELTAYLDAYSPTILRFKRSKKTRVPGALNIGVAKGSTFDRVLLLPTEPMKEFLATLDPAPLKTKEHLYVAVTRARFSFAWVADW